ncbi:DUF1631 family protein [Roseateles toxinivorans]|uniref:Uncharacterized protein DUF1631 n=1 Tax=Roseateles toxinivorans TaxID=270368 RepID=A0A4R6QLT2_9BURK|nr:DUF1631 family protein [Roseateles toxinivorans]TDP71056.1 uncharacterized protein DUF1631 [Roseateles toxinivorans]
MPPITPQSLVESVLSQAPQLARDVLDGTLARLEGRHQVKPRDTELALYFNLAEALRRLREPFVLALQERMVLELPAALQAPPTGLAHRPKPMVMLDELSLVDEQQALEDVAVAAAIRTIQEAARLSLQQLDTMFEAMRAGTAFSKRDANPLRPAVFARLLCHSLHALTLAPAARVALLRVAAEAMAEVLEPIYAGLCAQVNETDFTSLPAAPAAEPSMPIRDEVPTVPHTLDNLLRRMQQRAAEESTHPTPLSADALPSLDTLLASMGIAADDKAAEPRPPPELNRDFPPITPDAATDDPVPSTGAVELLSRVYDKILDDPILLPEVRNLLSRLQVSVLRVAVEDPQLLSQQEHPTWQFINCVASHSTGFNQGDRDRLQAFLAFVEGLVQRVAAEHHPHASLYWEALQETQQFIETSARQTVARTQNTIEMLERAQQREKWHGILRQQVREQLSQAVVSTTVRGFLEGPWVNAMAEAMVRFGPQAAQVQPMIDLVDDLLWSVQPLRHAEEREQLREMLPTLTARLQFGFDLINWPDSRRAELLDELMDRHSKLLRLPPDPRPAPSKMGSLADEDTTPSVHDTMDSLGASSSFWSDSMVDRGTLPTVPVPLATQDEAQLQATLEAWQRSLKPGSWCHMFVQSQWTTAQLTWISDSRNYFVFSGEHGAPPQSLTRGALLQLRAAGLLTELEDRNLVQRAVDTMMQDLNQ